MRSHVGGVTLGIDDLMANTHENVCGKFRIHFRVEAQRRCVADHARAELCASVASRAIPKRKPVRWGVHPATMRLTNSAPTAA